MVKIVDDRHNKDDARDYGNVEIPERVCFWIPPDDGARKNEWIPDTSNPQTEQECQNNRLFSFWPFFCFHYQYPPVSIF